MRKKTCILVGNAPLPRNLSAEIDAADFVFRFNKTPAFGADGGTRTDAMVLINTDIGRYSRSNRCYKIFGRYHFEQSPAAKAARQIILPINPHIIRQYYRTQYHQPSLFARMIKGRALDWTGRLLDMLGADKPITIFSAALYLRAAVELGIAGDKLFTLFPSTGFLCLQYCLEQFDLNEWDIKLCGFGWQGWERHLWAAERDWIAQQQALSKLSFIQ